MSDQVLCDGCGAANDMDRRNCSACSRLLDKRMWRFAVKVEKDYHKLGLTHTRAVVLQRERALRIEMPDASDEAVGAYADKLRARYARVYGIPYVRLAGFETIVLTNAKREEVLLVPRPWLMQSNMLAVPGVLFVLVIFAIVVVWVTLARASG